MKRKNSLFLESVHRTAGMAALVLALGLILAGCPTDSGGGSGGGEGGGEINLPAITETTTGLPTITGSSITVSGTGMPATLAEQTLPRTGAKFSITNGKLSFTLPASPANTEGYDEHYVSCLFMSTPGDSNTAVTANPAGAKFAIVNNFDFGSGSKYYAISRRTYNTTNYIIINYMYTDRDVILSRAAKTIVEEGVVIQFDAVNLSLRKGWNMVQENQQRTSSTSVTAAVKIADKDVPWTIEEIPAPEEDTAWGDEGGMSAPSGN